MDFYIHNLSPDLGDSNNESSIIASNALTDILSESFFLFVSKIMSLIN